MKHALKHTRTRRKGTTAVTLAFTALHSMFYGNIPYGGRTRQLQRLAENTDSRVSLLGNKRNATAFLKAVRGYATRNRCPSVLEHVRTLEKYFRIPRPT